MQSFPSGIPTWKIVSGVGGSFRWTRVNFDSPLRMPAEPLDSHRELLAVRFPSVKDFLHEHVESKTGTESSVSIHESFLKEGKDVSVSEKQVESMAEGVRETGGGGAPVVRVGLRGSVGVMKKDSSIQETTSSTLYRDEGHKDVVSVSRFQTEVGLEKFEFGGVMDVGSTIDCGNPTFRTASGRVISVKASSMRKAASILEEHDSAMGDGDDARLTYHRDDASVGFPMFKTASGKPVSIKQSSIQKAVSVFGETILGDVYVSQDHPVEDFHKPLQFNMPAPGSSSVEFYNRVDNRSERSSLISHDALQRARGLLGESGGEDISSLISLNKNIRQNKSFSTRPPCERERQSLILGGNIQGLEFTRSTSEGRQSIVHLKEASNTINANMSRENCHTGVKKRSGTKYYPSPFKKPRNSRFTPPWSNNTCFAQSTSTCTVRKQIG